MIKPISIFTATAGVVAMLATTAAVAGEIKGPPPNGNYENTPGTISNGNSRCSYSGLNDTPDGIPGVDPGGQVQSFGYFMAQRNAPYDPSSSTYRSGFAFPGEGCNPQRTGGTH
jgi:hypothetical protein